MPPSITLSAGVASALALAAATPLYAGEPVSLAAFAATRRPAPTTERAYGPSDAQRIDIFLPSGKGPFPVAILIHGGCWSVHTDGRRQLRHLGAELSAMGIAVWSIGYRRADEAGRLSGYVRRCRHGGRPGPH